MNCTIKYLKKRSGTESMKSFFCLSFSKWRLITQIFPVGDTLKYFELICLLGSLLHNPQGWNECHSFFSKSSLLVTTCLLPWIREFIYSQHGNTTGGRINTVVTRSQRSGKEIGQRSESPLLRHQWRSFLFISHADDIKRGVRLYISRLLANQKLESALSMG